MKTPTMLYKCPGPHEIHGGHFDTTVVDEDEVESAMADGWHLTTPDAKAAHEASKQPDEGSTLTAAGAPTRDEMKQKATELGLDFAGNISNVKLAELIEQALAAPKD